MKKIDTSSWKNFRIRELFYKLDLRCRKSGFNKVSDCSETPTAEFVLPLVNAKHFNNGIQFYGRIEDWDSVEMTIDIVSNGAIATGDVYAQPQRTGVLWDAYLIKSYERINAKETLFFLSTVIEKCVKQKFGYDNKCTWNKVKEEFIKLPVTSEGVPDWQYMETYMKRIMDRQQLNLDALLSVQ